MRNATLGRGLVAALLLVGSAACSSGDDPAATTAATTSSPTAATAPPGATDSTTSTVPGGAGASCPGRTLGPAPLAVDGDERSTEDLEEGSFVDVAVAPDGLVYAAGQFSVWCIDGDDVHEVWSLATGTYPDGTEDSSFAGIAVEPDGTPVVVDWQNPRAFRIVDGALEVVEGTDDPAIGGSRSIVAGADGTLHLTGLDESGTTFVWSVRDGVAEPFAGAGERGVAGDGGPAIDASFSEPEGLAVGPDGSVYVADRNHARVVRIAPDGTVETLAGGRDLDGRPDSDALDSPDDVAVGPDGALLVLEGSGGDPRPGPPGIYRVTGTDRTEAVLAADGGCRPDVRDEPSCPADDAETDDLYRFDVHPDGSIWIVAGDQLVRFADGEVTVVVAWD